MLSKLCQCLFEAITKVTPALEENRSNLLPPLITPASWKLMQKYNTLKTNQN